MGTTVPALLDDIQLFVSYSHADVDAAKELFAECRTLERDAVVSMWIDRDIGAGEAWRPLVLERVDAADIILLLLSPSFFASEFIRGYELKRAIERHRREDARVIPIAFEDCEWRTTNVRHLQVIPEYGTPIATLPDRHQAWRDVVGLVADAARRLRTEGLRRRPRRPGGQVWRVPFGRNPGFVGRDDDLAWLHQTLSPDEQFEATGKTTVAITGLGGIGKTQLVLDYLYSRRNHYRTIWWIRAEHHDTLLEDLAGLAEPLGIERSDPPNQLADANAVRNYLEHDARWLLVFDNASGPDAIDAILPRTTAGHVVITSRYQNWNRIAHVRELGTLGVADAAGLLTRVSGDVDVPSATALANELGCLPLALAQAGGYMSATGRSIAAYLDRFRTRRAELLNRAPASREYPQTVLTTWAISFEQVARTSPAAVALLHLSAFLAADAIPIDLLFGQGRPLPAGVPAELADPMAFDDCTAALRSVSLVTTRNEDMFVHRLVQSVGRDRMDADDRQQYAQAALALVNDAFPRQSASFDTWNECSRLIPHALAAVDHAAAGADPDVLVPLLVRGGGFLRRRGHFEPARRWFEHGLSRVEGMSSSVIPMTRHLSGELGSTLQEMGLLSVARERLEQVLDMARADPHCARLDVAHAHNDLGSVLEQMGELELAASHYIEVLKILDEECPDDDDSVSVVLNNCGTLMLNLRRPQDAIGYFEMALDRTTKAGIDHGPNGARHLANLGSAYEMMREYRLARDYTARALAMLQGMLGTEHPETVATAQLLDRIEVHMTQGRPPLLEELQAAEGIVRDLEGVGVLTILFDAGKLALDGPTGNAPAELLSAARSHRHAIIQLIQATFARNWDEDHPGDTSTGVAKLGEVAVCLSIDLSDEDIIARVKASPTFQGLRRRPAIIPYPVAGLQERLKVLETWSSYLPQLN